MKEVQNHWVKLAFVLFVKFSYSLFPGSTNNALLVLLLETFTSVFKSVDNDYFTWLDKCRGTILNPSVYFITIMSVWNTKIFLEIEWPRIPVLGLSSQIRPKRNKIPSLWSVKILIVGKTTNSRLFSYPLWNKIKCLPIGNTRPSLSRSLLSFLPIFLMDSVSYLSKHLSLFGFSSLSGQDSDPLTAVWALTFSGAGVWNTTLIHHISPILSSPLLLNTSQNGKPTWIKAASFFGDAQGKAMKRSRVFFFSMWLLESCCCIKRTFLLSVIRVWKKSISNTLIREKN